MKTFLLALALVVVCAAPASAAPLPADDMKAGTCEGILHRNQNGLWFEFRPEGMCEINKSEEKKVLAVCSAGHYCKVEGQVDDCKDSGECSEITNISSVSRKKPTMDQRIECVGVLKSYPVHVGDIDNFRLKDGHGGLVVTMDTGRTQSKDCDQWFDGKNWKKVNDACQEDKLCRVVGVIGPNGWKRVIKAEDYSEQD
jgi:hypothetical protein